MDIVYCDLEQKAEHETNLWFLTRDAQLLHIMKHDDIAKILNEYLLLLDCTCNAYKNRFTKNGINKAKKKYGSIEAYKNKIIQTPHSEHLVNFIHLCLLEQNNELPPHNNIMMNELSRQEFCEMISFYNELLEYVDKFIGRKFMFGDKISLIEFIMISQKLSKIKPILSVPQKKIHIEVPLSFNSNEYKQTSTFDGKIKYKLEEDNLLIIFDNRKHDFSLNDLWEIKRCLKKNMAYYVEWDSVTDKYAKIFFAKNDFLFKM